LPKGVVWLGWDPPRELGKPFIRLKALGNWKARNVAHFFNSIRWAFQGFGFQLFFPWEIGVAKKRVKKGRLFSKRQRGLGGTFLIGG